MSCPVSLHHVSSAVFVDSLKVSSLEHGERMCSVTPERFFVPCWNQSLHVYAALILNMSGLQFST